MGFIIPIQSIMLKRIFIQDINLEKGLRLGSIKIKGYLSILLSLLVITTAIYFLNLEDSIGLFRLMPFVIIGFAFHALLPFQYRLPFFLLITFTAILQLFGLRDGLALLMIGLGLFGIVKLPLSVRQRSLIALGAAFMTAFLMVSGLMPAFKHPVIPVVGSIFMFRMILYLYEQRFQKEEVSIWIDLNYFFLLPNLIFFIFPVVDYKTFTSKYYSKPAFETYQKGIIWMINGVIHLLLYRLIYYYLVPAPSAVLNIYDLLRFLAASYALIVRLAGIFHFSAGVICLFGFDLPRTFEHYFFAQNFSDLWRRINIYWRDFIMKVFYYPVYFKLKHLGPVRAMALTVLLIFGINWFLHGYQWFWIRGQFPLTVQDAVFWGVFGIAVALNSIVQAQSKRKRINPGLFSTKKAARRSLNIVGIFLFMSVLWSFWTTNDIKEWWYMMAVSKTATLTQLISLFIGLALIIAVGTGIQYYDFLKRNNNKLALMTPHRSFFAGSFLLLFLAVCANPAIHPIIGNFFSLDTTPIIKTKLNAADQENLFKGYYETLLPNNNSAFNQMEQLETQMPDSWRPLRALKALESVPDIRLKKHKPNLDLLFKEERFRTNQFGMHHPPIQMEKAANVYRIGLLGGSIELGGGIPLNQNMAQVAQAALNRNPIFQDKRFEILNFAVTGYHLPEQVKVTEVYAAEFSLDAIILTGHSDELHRLTRSLYKVVSRGHHKSYPGLDKIIQKAGVENAPSRGVFERNITPFLGEITDWGLGRIAQYCKSEGIVPIWAYLFVPESKSKPDEEFPDLAQMASRHGFKTVNLYDYVQPMTTEEMKLAPWDGHLNAKAHELYGKGIFKALTKVLQDPQEIN